jgi:hypothetical protein
MEGRLQGTMRIENEALCAEGCCPVECGPAKGFAHAFAAEVGVDGHFGQFKGKLIGLLEGNETGRLIVAGGDEDGALFGEDGFLRLGQHEVVDRFGRDAEMSGEPFPVDPFEEGLVGGLIVDDGAVEGLHWAAFFVVGKDEIN